MGWVTNQQPLSSSLGLDQQLAGAGSITLFPTHIGIVSYGNFKTKQMFKNGLFSDLVVLSILLITVKTLLYRFEISQFSNLYI